MKNQDKILEVLSEALRRQDRQTELLTNQGKTLQKVVENQLSTHSRLDSVEGHLNSVDGQLTSVKGQFGSLDYKFDRMFDLIEEKVLPKLDKLEKGEG